MRILQINSVVNSGSTGRIAEDIGRVALDKGHKSFIAYGRGVRPSQSKLLKIGHQKEFYFHGLKTILLDRHGFGSVQATKKLIKEIKKINPDVIGLHNLHGYYINIELLFEFLAETNIPVLWTLFDCWAFTGHCSYFDDINCTKWKTHCKKCPKPNAYPSSYFIDNSRKNFRDKKRLFTSPENLELVVHSKWLADLVKESFLKNIKIHIIHSGIDVDIFQPMKSGLDRKYNLSGKNIILGCAAPWSQRKGFEDFIRLRKYLNSDYVVVLIGLNKKQIKSLPDGIIGIERTESVKELAKWYSRADVFVNPTYSDNFPTTNLEALACGTPVITYNTGGSPEAVDEQTGKVVEKGDMEGLKTAIEQILEKGKDHYRQLCRKRAEQLFDKNDRYNDYLKLYEKLTS